MGVFARGPDHALLLRFGNYSFAPSIFHVRWRLAWRRLAAHAPRSWCRTYGPSDLYPKGRSGFGHLCLVRFLCRLRFASGLRSVDTIRWSCCHSYRNTEPLGTLRRQMDRPAARNNWRGTSNARAGGLVHSRTSVRMDPLKTFLQQRRENIVGPIQTSRRAPLEASTSPSAECAIWLNPEIRSVGPTFHNSCFGKH